MNGDEIHELARLGRVRIEPHVSEILRERGLDPLLVMIELQDCEHEPVEDGKHLCRCGVDGTEVSVIASVTRTQVGNGVRTDLVVIGIQKEAP